jgi:hypothetical protein
MTNKPITGDEQYFPVIIPNTVDSYEPQSGITIRQHFAENMQIDPQDTRLKGWASHLMGRDIPSNDSGATEKLQFWIDYEMKLRVMRADALIKALNEPQP